MKYRTYLKTRQGQARTQSNDPHFDPQLHISVQNANAGVGFEKNVCRRSMLNSWATLSGIGASICECRHLNLLSFHRITGFEADLVTWYTLMKDVWKAEESRTLQQPELPFCLKPLWHYTFMALAVNLDLLELVVGREGTSIPPSMLELVKSWVLSQESKRCLLHALCLQNSVASITVDSANAMHTARIIFSAALCWYCYMLYLPWCPDLSDSSTSQLLDNDLEYLLELPEIRLLREEKNPLDTFPSVLDKAISDLKRILGANPAEMKASTLCVLESTLRRLGTSGISRKFADLIQAFITGETQ